MNNYFNNEEPSKGLRPTKILNEEVKWDSKKTIVSKTDEKGTIVYLNDAFVEISEYNEVELIGEPHNIIRHPDMPKVVFSLLWKALNDGENYHAIVKNLTKTGRYYWVITDFTIDKVGNRITGFTGRRKTVPKSVIKIIEPLYKTLLEIENLKGEKASELYFKAYLQEKNTTYEDFVLDLFKKESAKETKKKRTLSWFFSEYV